MLTAKFGSIWPSCFRGLKYEKVNGRRRTPSDGNTSQDPLGQVS